MPEIAALSVADPPELWVDLGFAVEDGSCWVSGIDHQLGASGEGVVSWSLRGVDGLRELPRADDPVLEPEPTPAHPNGVVALDHVVVRTPDLDRTIDAFEGAGVPLRRLRDADRGDRPLTQAFFKLGPVVVEVVGSPADHGEGPAGFAGLAFTVSDLDATAAALGDRLRPPSQAVQAGRRIATLDRAAGSTVPMAFMTPSPPRA